MIDALARYYARRTPTSTAACTSLSERATDAYEAARETVRRFLNAADSQEIVFVRGTTEGINSSRRPTAGAHVGPATRSSSPTMEHHSNIVPWQMLCEEKGARLRVIPITDAGELLLDEYERC